jgi:hypothetical protein
MKALIVLRSFPGRPLKGFDEVLEGFQEIAGVITTPRRRPPRRGVCKTAFLPSIKEAF